LDYGSILNFEGAENIKNGHELLEYECEILDPRRWKSRSLKRTPEIRKEKEVGDLRTAAFINSLDKIAVCYMELGVFP